MAAAVEFDRVTKRFPGALALDDVTLSVREGSCHALCGENGAGKSTLGKILAGIIQPDEGTLRVHGDLVRFSRPNDALRAGVAMVHQELAFCENLSVAENLTLGSLPGTAGFLSRDRMRRRAADMLAVIGAELDVNRTVGSLSTGQQQLVQIASAVGQGARIVVFDEPTSSLSRHEAERLYDVMQRLRGQGVTSLFVSHRLDEIFRLADTISVLRDGGLVATRPTSELQPSSLIQMMIGRRLDEYFPRHTSAARGEEVLSVEGLSTPSGVRDVSFRVHAGEILGFAGLVGAGRSEAARAVLGIDPRTSGRIRVRGRAVAPRTPREAIAQGLGLVPEDRKRQGLVLSMAARSNAVLPILGRLANRLWLTPAVESAAIQPYVSRLNMRREQIDAPAAALSGGNQQKVVLMKWLAARCPVLFVDEPTRGVDVGAKAEIHAILDELAANGTAVVLISSEMPELMNLSTRILVFRAGRIAGEVARADASEDALMRLMAGVAA